MDLLPGGAVVGAVGAELVALADEAQPLRSRAEERGRAGCLAGVVGAPLHDHPVDRGDEHAHVGREAVGPAAQHEAGLGPGVGLLERGDADDQVGVAGVGAAGEVELVVVVPDVAAGAAHRERAGVVARGAGDRGVADVGPGDDDRAAARGQRGRGRRAGGDGGDVQRAADDGLEVLGESGAEVGVALAVGVDPVAGDEAPHVDVVDVAEVDEVPAAGEGGVAHDVVVEPVDGGEALVGPEGRERDLRGRGQAGVDAVEERAHAGFEGGGVVLVVERMGLVVDAAGDEHDVGVVLEHVGLEAGVEIVGPAAEGAGVEVAGGAHRAGNGVEVEEAGGRPGVAAGAALGDAVADHGHLLAPRRALERRDRALGRRHDHADEGRVAVEEHLDVLRAGQIELDGKHRPGALGPGVVDRRLMGDDAVGDDPELGVLEPDVEVEAASGGVETHGHAAADPVGIGGRLVVFTAGAAVAAADAEERVGEAFAAGGGPAEVPPGGVAAEVDPRLALAVAVREGLGALGGELLDRRPGGVAEGDRRPAVERAVEEQRRADREGVGEGYDAVLVVVRHVLHPGRPEVRGAPGHRAAEVVAGEGEVVGGYLPEARGLRPEELLETGGRGRRGDLDREVVPCADVGAVGDGQRAAPGLDLDAVAHDRDLGCGPDREGDVEVGGPGGELRREYAVDPEAGGCGEVRGHEDAVGQQVAPDAPAEHVRGRAGDRGRALGMELVGEEHPVGREGRGALAGLVGRYVGLGKLAVAAVLEQRRHVGLVPVVRPDRHRRQVGDVGEFAPVVRSDPPDGVGRALEKPVPLHREAAESVHVLEVLAAVEGRDPAHHELAALGADIDEHAVPRGDLRRGHVAREIAESRDPRDRVVGVADDVGVAAPVHPADSRGVVVGVGPDLHGPEAGVLEDLLGFGGKVVGGVDGLAVDAPLGRQVAGVAHDLRDPLGGLVSSGAGTGVAGPRGGGLDPVFGAGAVVGLELGGILAVIRIHVEDDEIPALFFPAACLLVEAVLQVRRAADPGERHHVVRAQHPLHLRPRGGGERCEAKGEEKCEAWEGARAVCHAKSRVRRAARNLRSMGGSPFSVHPESGLRRNPEAPWGNVNNSPPPTVFPRS